MNLGKLIGGIFIVAGTAIGAGMLALPLVSAEVGVLGAVLALVGIWVLMTITGLLVLEVNLALPSYQNSFSSMALATIGRGAQIIVWISCLLLLYSLTGAYISGSSSTLSSLIQYFFHWTPSAGLCAFVFTVILGCVVWLGTHAVDIVNRGVMSLKLVTLATLIVLMLPKIQWTNVLAGHLASTSFLMMLPIMLTSFGYHTVIPTLRNYLGDDVRSMRCVIILGSLLPLLVYLMWLLATLGIIPRHGHYSVDFLRHEGFHLSSFFHVIARATHSRLVMVMINLFANIAVVTSFLGVSIGLFDFLADGTKRTDSRWGRSQTALLTFIPPLIFAFIYPHGFVVALSYAAIFVTILEVILPALMAFNLRRCSKLTSPYQVWGGRLLLYFIMLMGVLLIVIEVLDEIHWIK